MKIVEDYLVQETGYGIAFWMEFIQKIITKSCKPNPDDPKHPLANPGQWMKALSGEVWKRFYKQYKKKGWGCGDGNIACSMLLSILYTLWSSRITRAKSYDPRRPVELRKDCLNGLVFYQKMVFQCMIDESRDPELFVGQEWDPPFAPNAKEGRFV